LERAPITIQYFKGELQIREKFQKLISELNECKGTLISESNNMTVEIDETLREWARESEDFPGCLTSSFPLETVRGVTISEKIRENLHKWESAIAFVRILIEILNYFELDLLTQANLQECGVSGRKYTHGEIHQKANSFTASLQKYGLSQGDSICILLPNIPEYAIVIIGSLDAGLTVSPINPAYTTSNL